MRKISDKAMAKWLLDGHERGGHTAGSFLRRNAKRYYYILAFFIIILTFFGMAGCWMVFAVVSGFAAGLLFSDWRWFKGMGAYWAFYEKVMDWDAIKKLSDDKPSA